MYYVSRICGGVALVALGFAIWFSIVLARADSYFRAATPEGVARAVEIAPRNTEYLALRALQLDYDGEDASALRKRIAELNPYSSAPRIWLGLSAETHGDSATAERWLLDAASVDHQFEPRWTLANFYFRAEKREEFWKWMRSALEVSYGDRTPAFDLCWRTSTDADEILKRAIPDRREVVGAYLIYLSQTKRVAALPAAARRLADFRDVGDLPLLFGASDEVLAAKNPAAADVWRLTGQAAPEGIFNGDFATAPLNHGFDWRTIESPGVKHVTLNAPAGHRITLNGQEPESCSLLRQVLLLAAGKQYKLTWETRTAGIKAPSGMEWRVGTAAGEVRSSEDWVKGELTFFASEAFTNLEVTYQRPVGETRADGNVELRNVRLEVAP